MSRENEVLGLILRALEKIVANTDALTQAVTDNTTAVQAVAAEVAVLNSNSDDQPAVDAATAQITSNNAALNALVPAPAA